MKQIYKCSYKGELQKEYGFHENYIIKEAKYIGLSDGEVVLYRKHPDGCIGWGIPWDAWEELKEDKSFFFEEVIDEN